MGRSKRVDCNSPWIDLVVVDWVACWVVGGKDGARARVWMHRGYFDWIDWVGDWGMDLYAAGNWWAREYVFVFAGGGYGWGRAAGGCGTFVLWGEGLGEEFTQRAQSKGTEITEKKRRTMVGCLGPSTARPDAPNGGAKEKIGPLRSG